MPVMDFRNVKRLFRGSTAIKTVYYGSALIWSRQAAANDADIIKLFAANEQGAWFDPSDFSTLFQDAAGTTPANTPGHPVGLILDKSGRGNHATQPTAARRPILGRHPVTGRRNELLSTEDLTNSAWLTGSINIIASGSSFIENTNTSSHIIRRFVGSGFNAGTYTVNFTFKKIANNVGFTILAFSDAGLASFKINSTTGQVVTGGTAMGPATCVVTPLADGYFRLVFTFSTTGVLSYWDIRMANAWPISGSTGSTYTGDGISGLEMLQPQFERGAVATPYQRVTTQFDVIEDGVDSLWYLGFDGTHSLLTGSVDFSNTDEMTAIAGLRKTTTGTSGVVVELGAGPPSSAGIFTMFAPHPPTTGNPLVQFRWWTTLGNTPRFADDIEPEKASPYSGVITGKTKANTQVQLRVNGKITPSSVSTSLSGNFGNFPLHIGARTANSIYYIGNLYGLVVRGKIAPDQDLFDAEFHMANKVGVSL